MKAVYAIADKHGLTMANVFHAGDGNLHPLIAFDATDEETNRIVHQAGEEIVAACLRRGGRPLR